MRDTRLLVLYISAASILLACGKTKDPGANPGTNARGLEALKASPEFKRLPAEEQRRTLGEFSTMEKEGPARNAQHAADRAELVRPPMPGWHSEKTGRHLRLTLRTQKTRYRVGERFWYQLELQNVGSEPVWFFESDSFFKSGQRDMARWKVIVDGREVGRRSLPMLGPSIVEPFSQPGFDRLNEEQQRSYLEQVTRDDNARYRRVQSLEVNLEPGETLRTRPGRFIDSVEKGEPPAQSDRFRELGPYRFETAGKHTIHVSFLELGRPALSERDVESMNRRGRSRSDTLRISAEAEKLRIPPLDSNTIEIEVIE